MNNFFPEQFFPYFLMELCSLLLSIFHLKYIQLLKKKNIGWEWFYLCSTTVDDINLKTQFVFSNYHNYMW